MWNKLVNSSAGFLGFFLMQATSGLAQTQTVNDYAILDVRLGAATNRCSPQDYSDRRFGEVIRIMVMCNFGASDDRVTVTFASDRKTVISVKRVQQLRASDPSLRDVLDRAVQHYGTPAHRSIFSLAAIYGNYPYSYRGQNLNLENGAAGSGFAIKGDACGPYGNVNCSTYAVGVVTYHLVDWDALDHESEAGERRVNEMRRERAKKIEF